MARLACFVFPATSPIHRLASDLQLTCYSLAFRHCLGQKEKALRFDVMVRTKKPKIQQLITQRTEADISRFLKILAPLEMSILSK